jgi:hypothetical protein
MSQTVYSLESITVASPCEASWEEMVGDDRVRFCRRCQRNVYNLSEMSRREALELVRLSEGRLCARFYRREDGTVLTQDCPVGLRAARRKLMFLLGGAAAAALLFVSWSVAFVELVVVRGSVWKSRQVLVPPSQPPQMIMGEVCPPDFGPPPLHPIDPEEPAPPQPR